MRQLFTLLLVAATAISVRATVYNVPIIVTVNGVSSEQTGTISIEENDGKYDLTMQNFMLQSEDGPMGVGNVALRDITAYQDGDALLLLASDEVTITDGDDPSVPFWMASILPPVNVDLRAKIVGDQLRCCLDIDLTEALGQVIKVGIGSGYQMPNPSFESWHTSTGNYVEPNAWHSFESATGSLVSMAGHHIEKSADAHTGDAAARIYSTSIFGIVANGTMTTGRMNAGSMSASNTQNNAYLDMSKTDVDGNGDPFYVPLCSRPDSVAVWMKFKQGKANSAHPYATISAVITDGTYYQDPEDQTYTNVVAKAKNNQIATTDGQWVRITAPFVYTGNSVTPKAVLITISTNADAGQGSNGDEVLVDDIEFVYNTNVTDLKVKGQSVADFSPEKSEYEMELNEEITTADIEAVMEGGETTHIVETVEVEGDYYVCTFIVINADMSASKTYIVKVKSTATAITMHPETTTRGASDTYYTLGGRQVKALKQGNVYIRRQADGTTTKTRR